MIHFLIELYIGTEEKTVKLSDVRKRVKKINKKHKKLVVLNRKNNCPIHLNW